MQKIRKIGKVAILTIMIAAILAAAAIVVSAYYMSRVYLYNDEGQRVFRVGMELNTFFDKLTPQSSTTDKYVTAGTDLDILCTDSSCGVLYTSGNMAKDTVYYINVGTAEKPVYHYVFNPDASWGSASNPYIISKVNHLQNLYVLQNIGYFDIHYLQGITERDLPFFLICDTDGSPIVIDGTGMDFKYIGTDAYPFIGYVGGAFLTTTKAEVNGKESSQSVIYNLKVESDGTDVDIGLFGHVGYLGNASGAATNQTTGYQEFNGAAATIRDFLLYDVTVQVKNKTVWEAILEKTAHLFSFSSVKDDSINAVMHETHHIGILAGHVDYATVEYISVYYSNDNIAALDVDFTQQSSNSTFANFFSISGIVGYMTAMNSTQAGGVLTIDGNSNSDIAVSSGGAGTGGGALSGEGRGYVTAVEIFRQFSDSGKIVKATLADGTEKYGILVQVHNVQISYVKETGTIVNPDGTKGQTNATLADGTAVSYADDLSYITTYSSGKNFWGVTEVTKQDWKNYIVHDTTKPEGHAQEYYYYDLNYPVTDTAHNPVYVTKDQISRTGVSLKYAAEYDKDTQTFTRLCTQYERERIGSDITNMTVLTDRYYFYDGVFTFSLSSDADTIEETWRDLDSDNKSTDKLTVGVNDNTAWTQDETSLPNSVLAFIKPVTSGDDLRSGKEIFIAYKDGDSYHIVTLDGNSGYTPSQGDNAVTTPKTTLSLASSTFTTAIGTSIENGTLTFTPANSSVTIDTLKEDWENGDIQVLNLGSVGATTLTLEELREHYQVTVSSRSETPTAGYFEDDGTTAISSGNVDTLKGSAKADSTGRYYSIDSVSEIMSGESYGVNISFFTLVGSTTANLNDLKSAISTNNSTYTSQESGNAGATVDISAMQNAINERNGKYYDANGTEVSLSDIGTLISVRNGKFYNASGTEVTLASLKTAIETRNATYYTLSGAVITLAQINAINAAIGTINNNYYSLGSSADGTAITDAPAIQTAINTINSKYYWIYSTNLEEKTDSNDNNLRYYQLKTGASGINLSTITSSAKSARPSSNYYESDGTLINSSSVLNSYLTTMTNGSGTLLTQSEQHKWGYLAFETNRGHSSWDGYYCSCRVFYIDSNGNINTLTEATSDVYRREYAASGYTDYLLGKLGISYVGEKHGQKVYKFNGTNYEGPLFYLEGGTYYSSCKDESSRDVIQPSGTAITLNSNGSYSSPAFTESYHYIVEKISGTGVKYYLDGKSEITAAPTATGTKISSINGFALYGKDFDLYSCSYSGTDYQCILIINYNVGGTFIKTTTGGGYEYSFYDGSSTTKNLSKPTAISTVPANFAKISVDGADRQLYSDGTRLGVMVANFHLDGILLQSTSGGGGTTYSVVNGSYLYQSDCGSSFNKWDIGQTVKVDDVTYNIYRSSDGKLGVRAYNDIIDGVLVQTLTGNGYTYSLKKADGSGTVTGITATGSQPTKSTRTITVSGVTYDLYVIGDKLGVLIENEHLDGIMLKTLTGSGYTYSMLDMDGKTIGSLSATFNASIGAHLDLEKSLNGYTVYKNNGYLGICVENERIDGIMVKTLTGSGYRYSLVNSSGTKLADLSATFSDSYTANLALEKTLGGYTVYKSGNYLGVCVENEHIDGILLTSSTGKGLVYSLINGSGAKLADLTSTFTSVSSTAHLNVQKTLSVGGKSYVVYMNNGKLGIHAENFVIDGVIVQTQTGSGVSFSLVPPTGSSTVLASDITFTEVSGKTITVSTKAHQVYLSSDGHYCLRLANIHTEGYAIASVSSTAKTNYKFYDRSGNETVLSSAPIALTGLSIPLYNGSTTKNYNLYLCDGKIGIEMIYDGGGQRFYYTFSHYSDANNPTVDPYYLRILKRTYTLGSSKYSMIVSTDSNLEDVDQFSYIISCRSVQDNKDCSVIFNADGSVYLQYTVSGETRYLSYSSSLNCFTSSSSQDSTSKLYLFTSEGTHDASFGEHMVPVAGTTSQTLNADEYVLWPNHTYLSTDTTTSAYNPASDYVADTSYSVKAISELYNSQTSPGWRNRNGDPLSTDDLYSVFSLGSGISEVSMMNLWGGNTGTTLGKNNYVKAPVGSTGEEAYIPTGCVAFRVTKTLASNKIRVIVAVPVSEFYYGESGNDKLDYSEDYSFCMWKIAEANETDSYAINIENCYASFELPRSTPYNPSDYTNQTYAVNTDNELGVQTAGAVKKYIEIDNNNDGVAESRAYLNGEQVLVAYEFDATEKGVYLLGCTKECRIVYFSADSTASTGNDGVTTSKKLGTIDFVYDNGNYTVSDSGVVSGTAGTKILTVRDTATSDTVSYGNYYYSSLDLLQTNNNQAVTSDSDNKNGYPNINNFIVYVRRCATHASSGSTTGYSTICWQAKNYVDAGGSGNTDAIYIIFNPYASETASDKLVKRDNGTVTRETTEPSN